LGFAEAGNNFHTLQDFDPFNNYRALGFGARIFMPAFGLLGIDWGYGFDTHSRHEIQTKWRAVPLLYWSTIQVIFRNEKFILTFAALCWIWSHG
jgi:hypothetical protein